MLVQLTCQASASIPLMRTDGTFKQTARSFQLSPRLSFRYTMTRYGIVSGWDERFSSLLANVKMFSISILNFQFFYSYHYQANSCTFNRGSEWLIPNVLLIKIYLLRLALSLTDPPSFVLSFLWLSSVGRFLHSLKSIKFRSNYSRFHFQLNSLRLHTIPSKAYYSNTNPFVLSRGRPVRVGKGRLPQEPRTTWLLWVVDPSQPTRTACLVPSSQSLEEID